MDEILQIMKEIGLPWAYHHFSEGEAVDPPFAVWLTTGSNNFGADDSAYHKINNINIELYTGAKDLELEDSVEAVLDSHGIFYNKTQVWIASERMFEVLYEFEMEG